MKQQGKLSYDLKGKTLQVYLYLMGRNEPSGIREIQRHLEFTSPSVANYQLEKLIDLNLVAQDIHGRYYLIQKVSVPALKAYVNLGKFMLPRQVFYGGFFTALLGIYLVYGNALNIFSLAFGIIGAGVFWYEALRMWNTSPVTVRIDLDSTWPVFLERKKEFLPYLTLGVVLIATVTIGFDAFSDLVGGYVQEHPEMILPSGPPDLGRMNSVEYSYPTDKMPESVFFGKQRLALATQENAFGPGVPLISPQLFSVLTLVLPFMGAVSVGSYLYIVMKIRKKTRF